MAVVRNSIPDAFRFPDFEKTTSVCAVHSLYFREWDNYERAEKMSYFDSLAVEDLRPLCFVQHKDCLLVRFVWDWLNCGAPERNSQDVFRLSLGTWGRFSCNGRFGASSSSGSAWHYHKSVFNIALLGSPDDENLFVDSKPLAQQHRLARLR